MILKQLYKKILPEKQRMNLRRFVQKLFYPLYLGNRYHCNCCNKSFRKFLPKGNIQRINAQCPYCMSLERVRLLDLYLKNEYKIHQRNGISVLHFAPEDCMFKKLAALDLEYIDGDIHPAYARNVIDITNISYANNYFDLIICSHVLGHVPDEKKAIAEMYRVLKSGGIALVMTVINLQSKYTFEDETIQLPEDRLKYYGEADLCRLHGLDFAERLAKPGFKVEQVDYRKKLPEELVQKNSLGNGDRELIFVCKK